MIPRTLTAGGAAQTLVPVNFSAVVEPLYMNFIETQGQGHMSKKASLRDLFGLYILNDLDLKRSFSVRWFIFGISRSSSQGQGHTHSRVVCLRSEDNLVSFCTL